MSTILLAHQECSIIRLVVYQNFVMMSGRKKKNKFESDLIHFFFYISLLTSNFDKNHGSFPFNVNKLCQQIVDEKNTDKCNFRSYKRIQF